MLHPHPLFLETLLFIRFKQMAHCLFIIEHESHNINKLLKIILQQLEHFFSEFNNNNLEQFVHNILIL